MRWSPLRLPALLATATLSTLTITGCIPSHPASAAASRPPQATAPPVATPPAPQPVAPPPPRQPTAEEIHVHQVIEQVEAAYARGEADYRKGMLAEAKTEFDRAVDLMLTCGVDIRSNSQLSDEFDHIVDQVNGLEMEAL
jgi:membrane-bound lytic murein transglycosylase D